MADKTEPVIPPRRKSLLGLRKQIDHGAFNFPNSNYLIVTTTKAVFSWSSNGITRLFSSGSKGIVAARKASNDDGLLAVADSHVVVLHDIRKGMQKSYKLKGSDVLLQILVKREAANTFRVKSVYFDIRKTRKGCYSLPRSKMRSKLIP